MFVYEVILGVFSAIGFDKLNNELLLDLAVIRIVEPSSKLRSIELIKNYFGIQHRRQNYYKLAPTWLLLKNQVESIVTSFAQIQRGFNYDLLFYDVTTLYFETFEDDELRKQGFSKDNKSQQPQILVALMVTKEGFPISYEIFAGNTFEGHTIIPAIKSFIEKNKVQNFTVIADAAMISTTNVEELRHNKINYVVGARLGNLANEIIDEIDKKIIREDGNSIRISTNNGYLICSYSSLRFRKDKYEMEKQIEKAKAIIDTPSKSKKVKFTSSKNEKLALNQKLINKSRKLLGIKGYYTDIEETIVSNQIIIDRYHELYKIEQAFRISKNDLQTRPIFHFKEEPIQLHLLICFMALVVSKQIELKTGLSIKKFITEARKITDARMINKLTGKEIRIRAKFTDLADKIINQLNLPH
jgi:transposase